MRIVGTIQAIGPHAIPSKMKGQAPERVVRVQLKIERAVDARGNLVDTSNLVGLPFQAPTELLGKFAAGERVEIVTTTPSGLHIASMRLAPLN